MQMKKIIVLFSLILLSLLNGFANAPVPEGKLIFSSRCASCHNVNKVVLGPALAGVEQRHSVDWIIHFVHSSQTVIRGGDPAAIALYEKFNKIPMPDHPDLNEENIKNVLAYIKSESVNSAVPVAFRPEKIHPAFTPLSITKNYGFFLSYFGLVALLFFALISLVKVKAIQRKEKENNI